MGFAAVGVRSFEVIVALRLAQAILGRLRRARNHTRYDNLDGIVSFSARLIAAARAVETAEEDALITDPLAAVLAGKKAIRWMQERSEAFLKPEAAPEQFGKRKYKISRSAIRTRWYDEQLLSALDCASHPAPLSLHLSPAADGATARLQEVAVPKQVVLLGAGMDSRAWRLPLPAGVRWFEVDRRDVLQAKRATLEAAGASFSNANSVADGSVTYPLKAESWADLEVDLGKRGWSKALEASGFDPTVPTVWLAEGLLMYLQPPAVEALLREMAGASAEGSVALLMSVTEKVLQQAKSSSSGLLRQFVFGCPQDPRQYLESTGWRASTIDTRADMVKNFHLPSSLIGFETTYTNGRASYFIVATPCGTAA